MSRSIEVLKKLNALYAINPKWAQVEGLSKLSITKGSFEYLPFGTRTLKKGEAGDLLVYSAQRYKKLGILSTKMLKDHYSKLLLLLPQYKYPEENLDLFSTNRIYWRNRKLSKKYMRAVLHGEHLFSPVSHIKKRIFWKRGIRRNSFFTSINSRPHFKNALVLSNIKKRAFYRNLFCNKITSLLLKKRLYPIVSTYFT